MANELPLTTTHLSTPIRRNEIASIYPVFDPCVVTMSQRNKTRAILVYVSCPTKLAQQLCWRIIDENLAACVHRFPEGYATYRWKDEIVDENETQLCIKTQESNYLRLEQFLIDNHPYELPEILAVPISDGYPNYLDWLAKTP